MNFSAAELNRTTNLTALVPDLKHSGRYASGPCPFCGGTDRFTVKHTDDGDLWHCRRCGPDKYQDAVAFLMRRDGRSFAEVVGQADPAHTAGLTGVLPAASSADQPPPDDWQVPVLAALKPCLDALHEPHDADGRAIWDYLQKSRGLSRDTIWNASLAYNAEWREVLPGHWLAPGIVIPGMVGGELWYVKVRTTRTARAAAEARGKRLGKYAALRGSATQALYNADSLRLSPGVQPPGPDPDLSRLPDLSALGAGTTAVVVEGEFDALLLGQCLPPGWAAVTMGSAGALPSPHFGHYLMLPERVLLALDADGAGRSGVAAWQQLHGRIALAPPLPDGAKDITDYWRAGGDLAAWACGAR